MAPSRKPPLVAVALLVVVSFVAEGEIVTAGETAPRRSGSVTEESLGASYNQLGLQHVLGIRWTRPLFQSPHPLLADAHVSSGFAHTLTPSYMRMGIWVELAPVSVLGVRAGIEPGSYFGTFGSLRSHRSYESCFDSECGTAGIPGSAERSYLSPTLRLRLGSLAMASTATMEWWWSSAAGPYYYEPSRDTLLRSSGDRLLTVSAVLVRQVARRDGGQVTYGLSYDLTYVWAAPGNRAQRVGVVAARRLASKRLGWQSPTVGLRVGYYLDHPQRKGQATVAAFVSVERSR